MTFVRAPASAAEFATLMTLAPMVIGARLSQMWLHAASPDAADRAEASLMVSEKLQAMGESVVAMQVATIKATTEAGIALMTGRARHVNDADDILAAGLKVYTKRVRANRRRLWR